MATPGSVLAGGAAVRSRSTPCQPRPERTERESTVRQLPSACLRRSTPDQPTARSSWVRSASGTPRRSSRPSSAAPAGLENRSLPSSSTVHSQSSAASTASRYGVRPSTSPRSSATWDRSASPSAANRARSASTASRWAISRRRATAAVTRTTTRTTARTTATSTAAHGGTRPRCASPDARAGVRPSSRPARRPCRARATASEVSSRDPELGRCS